MRPVDRLGDARTLEQVLAPQSLHERDQLLPELTRQPGRLQLQDFSLVFYRRVVNPVIEATPSQRVMHLPCPVGGNNHDGRLVGADGPEFGYRQLEIGQQFEQERFEGFVGAVDFIDQQYRRTFRMRLERLQERSLHQVIGAVETVANT